MTLKILAASLQEAVAQGLLRNFELMGQPECYFSSLAEELEGKRDRMAAILQEAGMTPIIPEGGYFMLVDVTSLSELLICLFGNNFYVDVLHRNELNS